MTNVNYVSTVSNSPYSTLLQNIKFMGKIKTIPHL